MSASIRPSLPLLYHVGLMHSPIEAAIRNCSKASACVLGRHRTKACQRLGCCHPHAEAHHTDCDADCEVVWYRVTEENKREYVNLVARHRMTTAIKLQINSFLEGFWDLVPKVSIHTWFCPKFHAFCSVQCGALKLASPSSIRCILQRQCGAFCAFAKLVATLFLMHVCASMKFDCCPSWLHLLPWR